DSVSAAPALCRSAMATSSHHRASAPLALAALARLSARPRAQAILCLIVLAGLGWLQLGLMVGASAHGANAPGALASALLEALCRPPFGTPSAHAGAASGAWDAPSLALVYVMWSAMAFAMMLPPAAGMVLTYADIAATAAAKGERVVAPPVLIAGYMA